MKKAILIFLLGLSMFSYGQKSDKAKQNNTVKAKLETSEKSNQVITDKNKTAATEKTKLVTAEKSKSVFIESLKPTSDKTKSTVAKDSVKATVAIEPEIIFNDSVIAVKGKFRTYMKSAHASYYHNKFNGKRTASGKKFSNTGYTAAHRKFPFGTILRITNEDTGKAVIVEVTDRGPFSRGREIDLTRRAFMEITANQNSGTMNVKIEVMD